MAKGFARGAVLAVYLLFLLLPALALFTNRSVISLADSQQTTYFFLRFSGLYAFVLLFLQIIHGAFMPYWTRLFGDRAVVMHEQNGILAYALILLHPTFFTLGTWVTYGFGSALLTLLTRFTSMYDYYLSLGKVAFTLITLSVFAAYFRHKGFLNRHWLKFHILNYVAFWLVWFHSFNIGSDTHTFPMSLFYPVSALGVAGSLIWRLAPLVLRKIRSRAPEVQSYSTSQVKKQMDI